MNVTASGLPWVARHTDARLVLAMAQQHGISEPLANILAGRGVALDDVPQFLNPTLREQLPDPFHLLDMDKAVVRLIQAIQRRERIAVFGDYDVDGATSTALLMRYFAQVGIAIRPYIPDRMKEGYGPTVEGFTTLVEEGAQLIITVDCGTLAHAPIANAKSRGVDVIVLDHHLGAGALPEAVAVVNPNRADETSPLRHVAAVGVTFLTLVALNTALRAKAINIEQSASSVGGSKYSAEIHRTPSPECQMPNAESLPNLLALLDLVALGTVCDVMPLTGLNRALVAQGLKVLGARGNLGLSTLADVAKMNEAPNVYHLGFLLGPRINAGGRVGAAGLGVALLTSEDGLQAAEISAVLDRHNAERQAIEAGVTEQALAQAVAQENMPVMLLAGEGWHPGVIGIVAGRLKEKYQRPVAVASLEGGMAKASARSVTGADMGAAIHAAQAEGLIDSGGGHAMAAGFSLPADKLAALHAFLIARLGAAVAGYQESRVLRYDAALSVSAATLETMDDIARAGPYGLGNPGPRFVLRNAKILHRTVLKEKHIKLVLGDDSGKARVDAIAFSAVNTQLGEWLMSAPGLSFLGELKLNRWQGRETAQLIIEDAAQA